MEIILKSKTSIGVAALKQHIKETKKIKLRERLIFKAAGYKQEIISEEDPIEILLTCNNKYIKYNPMYLPMLICEIDRALKNNGADKNTDYTILTKDDIKRVQ